ncbi:DUF4244 domain-containing protein [Flexivirga caeni]|uniref:DUF4244 domain-containing protein n=1 Tax=Flexivirga caeni TaxID=2294115 RepID=A0A3M9LYD7_9MICO|nr:DUF4244 domain-containing protein [Flexivirga caeni]RNI18310.1 DUF4244 domain-containing protein [Flexivirga caeni]
MAQRTVQLGLRLQSRLAQVAGAARARRDAGMTTAEYAVGTLAAVAFAAVLMVVVKSGAVKAALTGIIESALSVAS